MAPGGRCVQQVTRGLAPQLLGPLLGALGSRGRRRGGGHEGSAQDPFPCALARHGGPGQVRQDKVHRRFELVLPPGRGRLELRGHPAGGEPAGDPPHLQQRGVGAMVRVAGHRRHGLLHAGLGQAGHGAASGAGGRVAPRRRPCAGADQVVGAEGLCAGHPEPPGGTNQSEPRLAVRTQRLGIEGPGRVRRRLANEDLQP
mmetsp:Transcript_26576/g.80034  ORF Transcript_26576/g.80034 Transcript_26576/m.80034 type:complete len:200 (-) Transcript_26576:107-706(-)